MSTTPPQAERDDGGAAFPQQLIDTDQGRMSVDAWGAGGMSLRDWFAGQALSKVWRLYEPEPHDQPADCQRRLAIGCYKMADAMLAARKERA